jgi:DNA-binding NarL/FixJ family response regulator
LYCPAKGDMQQMYGPDAWIPGKSMTQSDRPTVVLADDHEGILRSVCEILGDGFQIVATVRDGIKAVEAAIDLQPDILVLDIAMPGLDGMRAAMEVKRLGLWSKLIFLTVQEDHDYVQAAHSMGASYVLKARMHIDLPVAMREALAGRTFVSPFSSLFFPSNLK